MSDPTATNPTLENNRPRAVHEQFKHEGLKNNAAKRPSSFDRIPQGDLQMLPRIHTC
jgi:hypothetical protein